MTSSPSPTSPTSSRKPTASSSDAAPELSVIVPVLDERDELPALFESLGKQQQVDFEVIVSDGGSTDDSLQLTRELALSVPFPVRVMEGKRGRGAQMNRGAAASRANRLLFLHADSRFDDPLALRRGVDLLAAAESRHEVPVAARFSLGFHFDGPTPRAYRFYEAKARLDRPGCTHGDQGFLLSSRCFRLLGPFSETLPFMEDTFFAERVRSAGRWLLLPPVILTSPRRFLSEGLLPRQTMNAVLMNLAFTGHLGLIGEIEQTYRAQGRTRRLEVGPFLSALKERIGRMPAGERRRFWYETGSYVRSQAWQVPFFLDRLLLGGKGGCLGCHDAVFDSATDNRGGRWLAAALTWSWFQLAARR